LSGTEAPDVEIEDFELAVAKYVDWYNNHRSLHGELGLVPPVEYETVHHNTSTAWQRAGA
jgi:putative transposase